MTYKLVLFLLFLGLPALSYSQTNLSPENMGLGGGGTSYSTGYEALFINPANLHFREKEYRVQIGLMQSGAYHDTPLRISHERDRFENFLDGLDAFTPGSNATTAAERNSILDRHYGDDDSQAGFLSYGELNWFGVKWYREERSFALALRTRYANQYTVGRGFYDENPVNADGMEIADFSLSHNYESLHEFSFGYSDSFTMLSGLFPRMSEFVIGIAPKIVLAGSSVQMQKTDRYERQTGRELWTQNQSYRHQSSGEFSRAAQSFMNTGDAGNAVAQNFSGNDIFSPAGIGFGFDLGLTYLITFGDDFSQLRRGNEITEKSLRLSIALTDLGAIHYFDDPLLVETESDQQTNILENQPRNSYFSGFPGEDLLFLSEDNSHPLSNSGPSEQSRGQYQRMMPTAVNAGALFQLNRVRVMGDFQLGLIDSAFMPTQLASFVGIEIRPIPAFPLRAGTRFSTNQSDYFSFGTGIETRYFDLNAGLKFRTEVGETPLEATAASFTSIKFYIP